ncbi:hypothetical protein [Streptomyces vastus]|uniref:Uncharacterized protein n=1 Tax=Streptomyces vastus TaxID=285451 RepID=A0ABN3R1N2_9ACTN
MIGAVAFDRGSRAFWTLVTVSVIIRAVVVYVACCLTMALAWQVGHRGTGVLLSGSTWAGAVLLALAVIGGIRSAVHLWKGLRATRALGHEVRARAPDDSTRSDGSLGRNGAVVTFSVSKPRPGRPVRRGRPALRHRARHHRCRAPTRRAGPPAAQERQATSPTTVHQVNDFG